MGSTADGKPALSDRQRALKIWGEWASFGWDRPDDQLADEFRFTDAERAAALSAYRGHPSDEYLSDEEFLRYAK